MENVIQPYDWGSRTGISSIMGRPDASGPEAEMWMGSHAKAPSLLPELEKTLLDVIREDPSGTIGERAQALNPPGDEPAQLPFLFKILAAEKGLSIQAHPDREGAAWGFAQEEEAGIDRRAPNRNYRDRNHKPELIYALEPFYGLCGFREFEEIAAEMRGLHRWLEKTGASVECLEITEQTHQFYDDPVSDNLRIWFTSVSNLLLEGHEEARKEFIDAVSRYARTKWIETQNSGRSERHNRYWWVLDLLRQFPGDPGAAGALYLNLFALEPGEALFLGARVLHAYLHGTGIEIMANSDNVLRAGCTVKHVDPAELARVLEFQAGRPSRVEPSSEGPLKRFVTPAGEFELCRIAMNRETPVIVTLQGSPAVVLVIEGAVEVIPANAEAIALAGGASCFVTAAERDLRFSGEGTLFAAALPGALHATGGIA